jgi:hypothetical protein
LEPAKARTSVDALLKVMAVGGSAKVGTRQCSCEYAETLVNNFANRPKDRNSP